MKRVENQRLDQCMYACTYTVTWRALCMYVVVYVVYLMCGLQTPNCRQGTRRKRHAMQGIGNKYTLLADNRVTGLKV